MLLQQSLLSTLLAHKDGFDLLVSPPLKFDVFAMVCIQVSLLHLVAAPAMHASVMPA